MNKYIAYTVIGCLFFIKLHSHASAISSMDTNEKKYLQAYGWIAATQSSINYLGLNEDELKEVLSGFVLGARGHASPIDVSDKDFQDYLHKKACSYESLRKSQLEAVLNKNKETEAIFFANLDKNPDIKATASGLYYHIIHPGEATHPNANSWVTIHYEGKLINDKVFDSSKARGSAAVFNLQRTIQGFKEGIQLIGKNGQITLYVPAKMGYGDNEIPGIPPGSTLIFKIELLDFSEVEPLANKKK